MFERIAEAYETLIDPDRRRQYDAGRTARAAGGGGGVRVHGVRFFVRGARDAQAATFSELFAEVLHPPAADAGRPEPGADLHAALTVSFEESMRGVERQVVVTRQVLCSRVPGRDGADTRGPLRAVQGQPARCAGRAATWCSRRRAPPAAARGRRRLQRCEVCVGQGRRCAARRCRCGCRPACATARGCGCRSGAMPAGAAGATAISTSTSRCSRIRCSAARATISLSSAGGGARSGARRAHRVPSLDGASG